MKIKDLWKGFRRKGKDDEEQQQEAPTQLLLNRFSGHGQRGSTLLFQKQQQQMDDDSIEEESLYTTGNHSQTGLSIASRQTTISQEFLQHFKIPSNQQPESYSKMYRDLNNLLSSSKDQQEEEEEAIDVVDDGYVDGYVDVGVDVDRDVDRGQDEQIEDQREEEESEKDEREETPKQEQNDEKEEERQKDDLNSTISSMTPSSISLKDSKNCSSSLSVSSSSCRATSCTASPTEASQSESFSSCSLTAAESSPLALKLELLEGYRPTAPLQQRIQQCIKPTTNRNNKRNRLFKDASVYSLREMDVTVASSTGTDLSMKHPQQPHHEEDIAGVSLAPLETLDLNDATLDKARQAWLDRERAQQRLRRRQYKQHQHQKQEQQQQEEQRRHRSLSRNKRTKQKRRNSADTDFSLETRVQASTTPFCVLCQVNERTHIAMPCMHFCLCEDCVYSKQETHHQQPIVTCPVCNQEGVSFSRVLI